VSCEDFGRLGADGVEEAARMPARAAGEHGRCGEHGGGDDMAYAAQRQLPAPEEIAPFLLR
jgi:hypothetical protein